MPDRSGRLHWTSIISWVCDGLIDLQQCASLIAGFATSGIHRSPLLVPVCERLKVCTALVGATTRPEVLEAIGARLVFLTVRGSSSASEVPQAVSAWISGVGSVYVAVLLFGAVW